VGTKDTQTTDLQEIWTYLNMWFYFGLLSERR